MIENKDVAIVLGGTVPHKELIRQLKGRGYYTILVDYLEDSPAKKEADLHIKESTLDQEMVLKIAKEYNSKLIIDGAVDQANISACYAMEMVGKKPPYSYDIARKITNKGYMKEIMLKNGIPTSKYYYVDKNQTLVLQTLDLRYPVMVKPADSNSSNAVRKAGNVIDAQKYLLDAIKYSRNGRAIIEEFITGQEISAYCYIKEGKANLLMTAERISIIDGENEAVKCYASIAPARISERAEKNAENVASQISRAFGLDNTFLFFQGFVNGERIDVIEFAPRIGGGVCFKTIKENTGFDPIGATIDNWEGKEVSLETWKKPEKLIVINTIYGSDGIFDHLENIENVPSIALFQIRAKGDVIDNKRASSSRIAFAIIEADDENEMLSKVRTIFDNLRVIDDKGNNIIRKDISLEVLWEQVRIDS